MSFRPTDLRFGNDIVNAYLSGKQLSSSIASKQQELALQKQQLEQQKELEEEKIHTEHDDRQTQFKMLDAMNEISRMTSLQEMGQRYSESGATPAGAQIIQPTMTPARPDNNEQNLVQPQVAPIPADLNNISEGFVKLHHPTFGDITTPTPDKYNEILAKRAEGVEKPKRLTEEEKLAAQQQQELFKLQFQDIKDINDRASREAIAQAEIAGRIQAAKVRGTSDKTISLANKIGNEFSNDPTVKRFNVLQEAFNTANNIRSDSKDPTQHAALLAAYAKALDPNKAYTQGTSDILQSNSQGILDSLGLKFNHITEASGKLTPDAINRIKNTINGRFAIEKAAYTNLRNQAGNKVRMIGEDPNNWITDHNFKAGFQDAEHGPIEVKTLKNGTTVLVQKNTKTGNYDQVQ